MRLTNLEIKVVCLGTLFRYFYDIDRNSKLLGIDIENKIKTFCNYATKISILEEDYTLSIPDEQKVINARKELEKIL